MAKKLVIFGASNIVSDLFDCALSLRLDIAKVVIHIPEYKGERDVSLRERLAALAPFGQFPQLQELDTFHPEDDELYMLGPTSPTRAALDAILQEKFNLRFTTLVHPGAYVSPMASLGEGVFIGAKSVVAPGAKLARHVFVNRGVTIGHDTQIGSFSRLQPGCNLGGLSRVGHSVTIGIGASLTERLVIGDEAFIGAGSIVNGDVAPGTVVVGSRSRARSSAV